MTDQQKKEIQFKLAEFVKLHESQAKAARALKDVSEATIIQIKNGRWEKISNEMWRVIAKQVGYTSQLSLVETLVFQTCYLYYEIAKDHGETFALIGGSGCGKTFAGKWYAKAMKGHNAYYIECASYWNKKNFLLEMIAAMGMEVGNLNIYDLMELIVTELRKKDKPVFIFDEIDKLSDPVLLFFITLYNRCNKLCGFVWTSTPAIKTRIERNVSRKIGFSELLTRISSFIPLPGTTIEEVRELCQSRGITDEETINRAYNESGGNVRRIDRLYLKKLVTDKMKKSA